MANQVGGRASPLRRIPAITRPPKAPAPSKTAAACILTFGSIDATSEFLSFAGGGADVGVLYHSRPQRFPSAKEGFEWQRNNVEGRSMYGSQHTRTKSHTFRNFA